MKITVKFLIFLALIFAPSWLFAGDAKILAKSSTVSVSFFGEIAVDLAMSEAVAPKITYLNQPARIILDFTSLDFDELPKDFGKEIEEITKINAGKMQDASRMVITFNTPYTIESIVTSKHAINGTAGLSMKLQKATDDEFKVLVQSLGYKGADLAFETLPEAEGNKDLPLIVLDAGHGGIDPGAVRGAVSEKAVTLEATRIFTNILLKSDRYQVALSRDKDVFLPLVARRRIAEELGAQLFISVHADTVEVGVAQGSTLYSLADSATSENAEKFALFENRVDLFAGAYLEGEVSDLTGLLTDMAQKASQEKANLIAQKIQGYWQAGETGRVTKLESAAFAVLKAPEIPSLLLELGYLSSPEDVKLMQDEKWLKEMGARLLLALDAIFYANLAEN